MDQCSESGKVVVTPTAVEPDTTALGRSVQETDRMVIRSMMEAVKDPAFNQALNSAMPHGSAIRSTGSFWQSSKKRS